MTKQQQFYLRSRQTEKEYLVAICDAELLGETLCDGDLELFVSDHFFGEELTTAKKCSDEMLKATCLNLIGKVIVDIAVQMRIINESSIMWITCPTHGQVAHAMLIR